MRIVQIIPGAGDFYCENCLRDTALLAALRQAGHDVLMVPLYLPIVRGPAEFDADAPVFFGALNVYLQQKSWFFRRTPRWLDKLFDSRKLLGVVARNVRLTDPAGLGQTTLSMLRGPAGKQIKELNRLGEYLGAIGPVDAVVLSDALLAGLAGSLREKLSAPVACLLQDEDEWLDYLSEPWRTRCWEELSRACGGIDGFIAVSRYFADHMAGRLGLPAGKLHVIHSGLDPAGYEPAPAPPAVPTLGFLSRLCRHKGLELLVEAFEILAGDARFPNLRLRAAGGHIADDVGFLADLRRRLERAGLAGRVEFLPNLERAARQDFLRSLSVMCVPSLRPEAFGRYIIEALAAGVPVVAADHGATGEMMALTDGGRLVKPNDPAALAEGLAAILSLPNRGREMGLAARQLVLEKFDIHRMAGKMVEVLEKLKTES